MVNINTNTNIDVDIDDEDDTFDNDNCYDEYTQLDGDVLIRVKQNDPTIDKLEVALSLDFAAAGNIFESNDIMWTDEGQHIAKNTHIKMLAIDHMESPVETSNTMAFYSGVSKIRSVKHLYIGGLVIGSREIMQTLSPTFQHNRLRSLYVNLYNDINFTGAGAQHLTDALSTFTSLRKFKFSIEYGGTDALLAKIVTALDKHKNLRELSLEGNYIGKGSYIALGQLLQNPKLEVLNLDANHLSYEGVATFGKSLGQNSTIKRLSLCRITRTEQNFAVMIRWASIFRGIASSSLVELSLENNKFGGEVLDALAAASIHKCTSLKVLDLGYINDIDRQTYDIWGSNSNRQVEVEVSTKSWTTLFELLLHPNSALEELRLPYNQIGGEVATALGNALVNNSSLKTLSLSGNRSISSSGWTGFFKCLSSPTNSLEDIELEGSPARYNGSMISSRVGGLAALAALAAALSSNTKLKRLNLSHNPSNTPEEWQMFFSALQQNSNLALEELNLERTNIDDTVMSPMVAALVGMRSLSNLYIGRNRSVTSSGWGILSNLLPNSDLIVLDISNNNNINDEVVMEFANSLVNNTWLSTLNLGLDQDNNITIKGWDALASVLCNKSSIGSIHTSNHALRDLGWESPAGDLISFLDLNRNVNKIEVARQKILRYHFFYGENNIEEFVDMELNVIPRAMAWIGSDDTGHSLMYQLVKSIPLLFEFDSKAKGIARKRKLGY